MSVGWSYCNDISVFVLESKFPHMSKASIGLVSANVVCTAPDDYITITVQMVIS
jgi:hypothetical protein